MRLHGVYGFVLFLILTIYFDQVITHSFENMSPVQENDCNQVQMANISFCWFQNMFMKNLFINFPFLSNLAMLAYQFKMWIQRRIRRQYVVFVAVLLFYYIFLRTAPQTVETMQSDSEREQSDLIGEYPTENNNNNNCPTKANEMDFLCIGTHSEMCRFFKSVHVQMEISNNGHQQASPSQNFYLHEIIVKESIAKKNQIAILEIGFDKDIELWRDKFPKAQVFGGYELGAKPSGSFNVPVFQLNQSDVEQFYHQTGEWLEFELIIDRRKLGDHQKYEKFLF